MNIMQMRMSSCLLTLIIIIPRVRLLNNGGLPSKDDWSMVMEVEVEHPEISKSDSIKTQDPSTDPGFQGRASKCGSRLCYNQGICIQPSRVGGIERCLCPLGFHGHGCEKVNSGYKFPKVEEAGFLKFTVPAAEMVTTMKALQVKLELRPILFDSKRLVAHVTSKKYRFRFVLLTEGRELILKYSQLGPRVADSSKKVLRHSRMLTLTGEWITVEFGYTMDSKMFLTIDNSREEVDLILRIDAASQGVAFEHDEEDLFIGGHPSLVNGAHPHLIEHVTSNFVGCVQNIFINGRYLDPRRKSFIGDAVEGYGLTDCSVGVCDRNKCQNNGTCSVLSAKDYQCLCPLHTSGDACQSKMRVAMPRYTGNSFIGYKGLQGTSRSKTAMKITFKPNSPNGLLLYQGYKHEKRGDLLAIWLVEGHVQLAFDLGSGTALLRSTLPLSMNEWHTVRFWLIGRQGFMQVDSDETLETQFAQGPLVQLTLDQYLYVGSHPEPDWISTFLTRKMHSLCYPNLVGFVGCVQELILNGHVIDLLKDTVVSANIENCAEHACARGKATVCDNGAECVPTGNQFFCKCPLGFISERCQTRIELAELKRIAMKGHSYLKYNSSEIRKTLNMPHFDVYLDLKPSLSGYAKHRSKANSNYWKTNKRNAILLALTDSSAHKPCLSVYMDSIRGLRMTTHSEKSMNDNSIPPGTIPLNFNQWHKLMLKRRGNLFTLYLNGTVVDEANWEPNRLGCHSLNTFFLGDLSTGLNFFWSDFAVENQRLTTPDSLDQNTQFDGYSGCLENFHVNGKAFLLTLADDGANIERC